MSARGAFYLASGIGMLDYSYMRPFRPIPLAIAILLLLSAAGSGAEPGLVPLPTSIRIVCDNNYPPYAFVGAEGKLEGIVPDQWRAWEEATGVKADLVGMPWAAALVAIEQDEADVIDTISETPEREMHYEFTPSYVHIEVPIFIHKSISGIASVRDLEGFRVGVKAGDVSAGDLLGRGVTGLVPYESYADIVDAAARLDLRIFCIDKPPALYYLYKRGIDRDFRIAFVLNREDFHRAVKKGRGELLGLVEKGFAAISASTYAAIDRKWIGSELARGISLRLIAAILASAFAAVALLLGIAWALRRRVRAATSDLREKLALLEASEERNRAALAEKEILLKEIHHRVKNNMQIVSSIIQLKAGGARIEEERSLVADIQQRIQAMAELHELLYRSRDLSSIDASEYLEAIASELNLGYGWQGISFSGESLRIGIDAALPLGLAASELLINSLKYAYPPGERGRVALILMRRGGKVALRIEDEGRGLPEGVDPVSSTSMGFTIVRGLADQLRASLAFGGPPGFWTEMLFEAPGLAASR
jgi:two-component sensor histidine kinase/ABC-type amino acid transport substrate-binding protein